MSKAKSTFISSFTALNFTQFFAALNDNLYKLLLVFFVISIKGEEHSNTILALAGAIFVIPFLLFASTAGTLADRFSKRTIIYITRLIDILSTALGFVAFIFKSVVGGYIVLFLMATHSALFSPCKYGIIPEIVRKDHVPKCNGMITAATYLAIILGTFFASFITEISNRNFVLAVSFCVLIATIGTLCSLKIEKTKPQAKTKRFSHRFIAMIFRSLKKAKRRRYLFGVIVFGAYFLFMGAYTQLNIIPFTFQSLGLSEIYGGYLFLMTAIGIGIGSFLAGRFSGKEVELGFVPLAAFGVALCYTGLYLFNTHFYTVVPLLIIVGMFGGFYIVPVDIFIQVASPPADRGQNVAASNFLSFIGVIIASAFIALFGNLFGLTAAQGFLIVGLLTFIMSLALLFMFADQVLRLIVAIWTRSFCNIRAVGRNRIQTRKPTLLVAPRSSWLDTIVIMATLPRLIRYIVPTDEGVRPRRFLYNLLWLIQLDLEHFSPIGPPAIEAIKQELQEGHSVCLMHPVDMPASSIKEWTAQLKEELSALDVPILPIHIERTPPKKEGRWNQIKSLSHGLIKVTYGPTKE